jgi:hypothetical protein
MEREMLSARRRINLSHMRDSCHKLGMKLNQGNSEVLSSWQEQEERFSSNVLGHLPDKLGDEDPWKQMKWVVKPACCKVKGQLIESLENTYNFQRGFSLKYVRMLRTGHISFLGFCEAISIPT